MSESQSDEGIYDFAPETPRLVIPIPVRQVEPPKTPSLEYRAPQKNQPAKLDTENLKNFQIPLALLAGSAVIDMISAAVWSGHPLQSTVAIMIDLIFGTAFMLTGIFIAARFRHIQLGEMRIAILKLAAICVAPAAVVAFLSPITRFIPLGFLIGWIVQFICYFALLGALFDLDESDTWYCVWTILVVRLAVFAAMIQIGHLI